MVVGSRAVGYVISRAVLIAVCVALAAPSASLAAGPVDGGPVTGRLAAHRRVGDRSSGSGGGDARLEPGQEAIAVLSVEFTASDARLLADEGFTVVRIGFIWQGLEPSPGRYDDGYVARIAKLDTLLGRYGIRTLVDFHQDGWSKGFGFDGAPAWADNKGGPFDSFAAFWRNAPGPGGVGIQTRFIAAWRHVAHALRKHTNILGFDPFNEPYPGSDYTSQCGSFNAFSPCPVFEQGALASFYRRVTAAIRAGGAHQIIWPEGVAQNGQAPPALPRFRDPQTAFNFHYYCSQTQFLTGEVPLGQPSPATAQCAPEERKGIGTFLAYARRIGAPSMLSEFSCTDIDPDNAQIVDLVGRSFISWTAWAYYRNVPDPANCMNQGLLDQRQQGWLSGQRQATQTRRARRALPSGHRRHTTGLQLQPQDRDDDPDLPPARRSRSKAEPSGADAGLHSRPPVPKRLQAQGPGGPRRLAPDVAVARARRTTRRVQGDGHRDPARRRPDRTPTANRDASALVRMGNWLTRRRGLR